MELVDDVEHIGLDKYHFNDNTVENAQNIRSDKSDKTACKSKKKYLLLSSITHILALENGIVTTAKQVVTNSTWRIPVVRECLRNEKGIRHS